MQSVGDGLVLWGNALLSDVTGLHSVESVTGDLTVANNPKLASDDAEALRDAIDTDNISGSVTLSNNGS